MIIAQIRDSRITHVGGESDRKYATATHPQRTVAHLTRLPASPGMSPPCVARDDGVGDAYEPDRRVWPRHRHPCWRTEALLSVQPENATAGSRQCRGRYLLYHSLGLPRPATASVPPARSAPRWGDPGWPGPN
jgi:hypothetical protein